MAALRGAVGLIAALTYGPRARPPAVRRLDPCERRADLLVVGLLLAVGVVLVAGLGGARPFDPVLAGVLVAAYACVMHVRFQLGAGYVVPTQVVLVPMLFLLPPETVPLLVAAAALVGTLPAIVSGRAHPERALVAVANGAFAIGPALVFASIGPAAPVWLLCAGAFVAQVITDLAASTLREWLWSAVPPSLHFRVMALVALVDALLWPIGVLAALAAQTTPWGVALVLPLPALLALLARDRNAHLDQVRRQSGRLERAAQRIGAAFASRLDRATTLALILDAAIDLTDAACGRVTERCGDEEPSLLVESADHGGAAAGAADAVWITLSRGERDGRPLVVDLWLGCSGPFSAAERALLEELALQAAVSMENVARHERLAHQAATDELTGLLNHRRFHEVLVEQTAQPTRFRPGPALVLLDIDDFKRVNDSHGHQRGDEVLIAVARAVESGARGGDHVARYGGEELAVVLPRADLAQARAVAERVRERIEAIELRLPDGRTIRPTASLGVAILRAEAPDKDELIAAADAALYAAKRGGKNQTVCAGARDRAPTLAQLRP